MLRLDDRFMSKVPGSTGNIENGKTFLYCS